MRLDPSENKPPVFMDVLRQRRLPRLLIRGVTLGVRS